MATYRDYDDAEECFHEDYEADVNGRATCCRCGHVFYLTAQDYERERECNAAYDKMCRQCERHQALEYWKRRLFFWRRWRKPKPIVFDEVPF